MPAKTVAIVDDEPLLVDMLSTFLQLKGYQVCSAYSGNDGLELVQMEKPDALLLDLMLPDKDGFQVCKELRAQPAFAGFPILIVSARTDQASKTNAVQAGASDYLTKPVRLPDLLACLDRLFASQPIRPPEAIKPPVAIVPPPAAIKPPTTIIPPKKDEDQRG